MPKLPKNSVRFTDGDARLSQDLVVADSYRGRIDKHRRMIMLEPFDGEGALTTWPPYEGAKSPRISLRKLLTALGIKKVEKLNGKDFKARVKNGTIYIRL